MMMKVLCETKSKHDGFTIFYNSCSFHSHLICHWWIYFACWLFQFQLKNKVSVRVNDNGDCGNFAKKELTNTNGLVFKLFLKKQWQIHEFPWIATFFILRGLVVFFQCFSMIKRYTLYKDKLIVVRVKSTNRSWLILSASLLDYLIRKDNFALLSWR